MVTKANLKPIYLPTYKPTCIPTYIPTYLHNSVTIVTVVTVDKVVTVGTAVNFVTVVKSVSCEKRNLRWHKFSDKQNQVITFFVVKEIML